MARRDFDDDVPEGERPAWYFDFETAFAEVFWVYFDRPENDLNRLSIAEANQRIERWDNDRRDAEDESLRRNDGQYYIAAFEAVYMLFGVYCGRADPLANAPLRPLPLTVTQRYNLRMEGRLTFTTGRGNTYTVNPIRRSAPASTVQSSIGQVPTTPASATTTSAAPASAAPVLTAGASSGPGRHNGSSRWSRPPRRRNGRNRRLRRRDDDRTDDRHPRDGALSSLPRNRRPARADGRSPRDGAESNHIPGTNITSSEFRNALHQLQRLTLSSNDGSRSTSHRDGRYRSSSPEDRHRRSRHNMPLITTDGLPETSKTSIDKAEP
ncbi:hypothetical protein EG329_012540 [Mollisiaceae sp. DMI_Dod_QoI]|nr:hypothetical protein EG329_012540 [Helotiales sp. DMI_Dod_QoI]